MDSPLISVIVPVYNAEHTLKECVDSILIQSIRDFELILVDDGSKDSSPKLCDQYASIDSRVVVIHQENAGVSTARNKGLDIARGEWITFIDSDDFIEQNYFEGIDNRKEDIIIRGYKKLINNKITKGLSVNTIDSKLTLSRFIEKYATNSLVRGPVLKFYQQKIINHIRFVPEMKVGEDTQFVFNYLSSCNSYFLLPDSEYVIRLTNQQNFKKYAMTVQYAVNSLRYLFKAYKKMADHLSLSKKPFISYIGYFKKTSKNEWGKKPSLWYRNKDISILYKYVWKDLPFKQKIKYITIKILSI